MSEIDINLLQALNIEFQKGELETRLATLTFLQDYTYGESPADKTFAQTLQETRTQLSKVIDNLRILSHTLSGSGDGK